MPNPDQLGCETLPWLIRFPASSKQRTLIATFAASIGFVVMSNHVHMLITPYRPLREVTNWIKGVSARRANQVLGRTGAQFWQDESFDHWARSRDEFEKIERYILDNPVRAGLVREPAEWKFSTAGRTATTD